MGMTSIAGLACGGNASTGDGAGGVLTELPTEVGTMVDTGYTKPEACCTRRDAANAACPPGAQSSVEGILAAAGDAIALSGTPNTAAVSFEVTALMAPSSGPVTVELTETDALPPSGILDLSPIFSVGSTQTVPSMAARIPWQSNQSTFRSQSVGTYFSEDGQAYRLVEDTSNAGFVTATMPGGGFIFVGSIARQGDCG